MTPHIAKTNPLTFDQMLTTVIGYMVKSGASEDEIHERSKELALNEMEATSKNGFVDIPSLERLPKVVTGKILKQKIVLVFIRTSSHVVDAYKNNNVDEIRAFELDVQDYCEIATSVLLGLSTSEMTDIMNGNSKSIKPYVLCKQLEDMIFTELKSTSTMNS